MKSIIYVGMDVHSTNYTLASFMFGNEQPFAVTQVDPDYNAGSGSFALSRLGKGCCRLFICSISCKCCTPGQGCGSATIFE